MPSTPLQSTSRVLALSASHSTHGPAWRLTAFRRSALVAVSGDCGLWMPLWEAGMLFLGQKSLREWKSYFTAPIGTGLHLGIGAIEHCADEVHSVRQQDRQRVSAVHVVHWGVDLPMLVAVAQLHAASVPGAAKDARQPVCQLLHRLPQLLGICMATTSISVKGLTAC